MKKIVRKEIPMGSKTLVLETGKIARQATASVIASMGNTVVMCAIVTKADEERRDFFPLSVHYSEKTYAAGKIPGGYFKREARPTEFETLTSRLIDRPLRPLFPDFFTQEVQVNCMLISLDKENPPDVVAMLAASAAMSIADVPFNGPIGGARVGFIDDEYVLNPSFADMPNSDLDMVVAGTESAVLMVESDANELSEDLMIGGILFAHQEMQSVIKGINEFADEVLPERKEYVNAHADEEQKVFDEVNTNHRAALADAFTTVDKKERGEKISAIKDQLLEGLDEEKHDDYLKQFKEVEKDVVRENVLSEQKRIDGRSLTEVRDISIETNFLPSVHGSALFTRGETQAIVTATLGSSKDVQIVDALAGETKDNFMLHYNFPSYSVGELGFPMGPKRREIGHGALAKRSLRFAVPTLEEFPYAIRVVSEITESNGSSSMASVCGGCLALRAAGVPVEENIAGVAMGLIKDGDRFEVLTDILGDEDHLGDMDFKVAGTKNGVSGLQMDIKIEGINEEILEKALTQARDARMHILGIMDEAMPKANELTSLAPYFCKFKVHKDKVKVVIGKGGSTIKGLQDEFGVTIELQDDGSVSVFGENKAVAEAAKEKIELMCAEPEEGKEYDAVVAKIVEFGAFVTFMPGKDGLLHISQFKQDFEHLTDVINEGDNIRVKVTEIRRDGKVKLEFADSE
ncbi:MAG: polyribonucleotide nucleotidyltransferase [Gammaproteobacteria bacterium]|jgi:polyribonucleotide nucleotidyltransferase|nr:polyribonucleotide nucleotidyltransferase [Pseudomonadota bacterium]MEC7804755.1 polyribonucleotide nucleotidyltransferase [Pseudomonadota bacterium]GIR08743.1 MAG: polyribonucleotide nucleotidyltransferase [Gammaproteobacteria bacterium]|tara:strand:- start:2199 stop:4265 length:2067 start_codon:yes stop_codon:yes gene_type:complete